jgi:hypothetical protein
MDKLNTHTYDAQWKKELQLAIAADNIPDIPGVNLIELSTLSPDVRAQAANWREQLAGSHDERGSNEDSSNGVNARDILSRLERSIQYRLHVQSRICEMTVSELDEVCKMYGILRSGDTIDFDNGPVVRVVVDGSDIEEKIREANISLIDSYVEQLADIQNGSCPQGRTTRLFQIYVSLHVST